MKLHRLFTGKVKLGKKGQITIPKVIREEDGLSESDVLRVTHMAGGSIVLEKVEESPDDKLFEFLKTMPRFDWRKAWEEVRAERRRDR